jgi:glycosyltransferase involved in cell wall biosynthesis
VLSRPVRVLLIAPSLDIVGGQAVEAKRLLDDLRREPGLEIDFLPVNPRLTGPFSALQRLKYARTAATTLKFVWDLAKRAGRYDVLHAFSAAYWSFLLTAAPAEAVGRVRSRKTIVHYHDGRAPEHLARWRTARLLRLADRIVTPSEYLVKVFAEHGYRAQAIFNHIDLARFRYRERAPVRPVFLHNRGMEAHYNVPCTLRAFALVQQRYPEASLEMAHDGPMRAALERMARDLGLRNVRFLGKALPEAMPALYDRADIYLTSPNADNMPLSLLECYASGLPAVATKAAGIPYIARDGETALLVPPDDHEAMARAALRLIEEDGLALRLARAARRECERYSWPAVRHQWLGLYRELAGR